MTKKILATLALLLTFIAVADATISVPNIFVPFTTISSTSMNSNFSTVAEAALNRHGDNIDGNITVSNGVTIDGADISAYLAGGKLTATSNAANAINVTGGITAGSGVVAIVGTDGRIPALSTTFLANLSAASLTAIPAAQVTGILPLQQYTETETAPTISASAITFDLSLGTYFKVALNSNVTITLTNPPTAGKTGSLTVIWVADGTPRVLTWPASVKWPSGSAPTPTSTNGKQDIYSLFTVDGGTTYYGFIAAQNY